MRVTKNSKPRILNFSAIILILTLPDLFQELAAYYQLTDPDLSRPLLSSPASPSSCYDSSPLDHPILTPPTPQEAQEPQRSRTIRQGEHNKSLLHGCYFSVIAVGLRRSQGS